MEIKQADSLGINFIIKEEGLRLKPYRDAVGVPTIGVGSTYYEDGSRVKMTDPPITKERAIELFKNILSTYEKQVWSLTRDDITQNNFNALVSLIYNIGVNAFKGSTVLRRVNKNPEDLAIKNAFLLWKNSGGRPILLQRRMREADLYFTK